MPRYMDQKRVVGVNKKTLESITLLCASPSSKPNLISSLNIYLLTDCTALEWIIAYTRCYVS